MLHCNNTTLSFLSNIGTCKVQIINRLIEILVSLVVKVMEKLKTRKPCMQDSKNHGGIVSREKSVVVNLTGGSSLLREPLLGTGCSFKRLQYRTMFSKLPALRTPCHVEEKK